MNKPEQLCWDCGYYSRHRQWCEWAGAPKSPVEPCDEGVKIDGRLVPAFIVRIDDVTLGDDDPDEAEV